jgi:cytochrome c553
VIEYEDGFCDCGDSDALLLSGICKDHSKEAVQIEETEKMRNFKDSFAKLLFNLIYYHKYESSFKKSIKDISQSYYYIMQEMEILMRKNQLISSLVSEVLTTRLNKFKDTLILSSQFSKIIKSIKKCSRNDDLKKNLKKLNFKNAKKKKNQVLSNNLMNPSHLFKNRVKNLNFLSIMIIEEEEAKFKDYVDEEWNSIEVLQGFLLAGFGTDSLKFRLAQTLFKYYDCYEQDLEDLEYSVFSSSETMREILTKPELAMAGISCLSTVNLFEAGSKPSIEYLNEMLEMFKNLIEKIWCSRLTEPKNSFNLINSKNLNTIIEVFTVLEVAVNLQFDAIDEHREEDDESELEAFLETWMNFIFDLMVGCNRMDSKKRESMLLMVVRDSMQAVLNVDKVYSSSKQKNKDEIYKELRCNGLITLFSVACYNLFCINVDGPSRLLRNDQEVKLMQPLFKKIFTKNEKTKLRDFNRILINRLFFNEGRRTGVYRKHYNVNMDENQYFLKEWLIGAGKVFKLLHPSFEQEYFKIFDDYLLKMKGSEFFDQMVNLTISVFYSRNILDFLFLGLGIGCEMGLDEEVLEMRFNKVLEHTKNLKNIAAIMLYTKTQMKIKDFEEVINFPFEEDIGTMGSRLKIYLLDQISIKDEKGFCKLKNSSEKPRLFKSLFLLKPNILMDIEVKLQNEKEGSLIEVGHEFLDVAEGKGPAEKLMDLCVKMGTQLTQLEINQESKDLSKQKLRNDHGRVIRGIKSMKSLGDFLKLEMGKIEEILKMNQNIVEAIKDEKEKEKKKQKIKKKGKKLMAKIKKRGKKKMAKIKELKEKKETKKEEVSNIGKCYICHEDMENSSEICSLIKRQNYDVFNILKDQKKKELKHEEVEEAEEGSLNSSNGVFLFTTCGHEYHIECILKSQEQNEDSVDLSFFKCSFCHVQSDNYLLSKTMSLDQIKKDNLDHFLKELKGISGSNERAICTIVNCALSCTKLKNVLDMELFKRRILPCSQQIYRLVYLLKEHNVEEIDQLKNYCLQFLENKKFKFINSINDVDTNFILSLDCYSEFAAFVIYNFLHKIFDKTDFKKEEILNDYENVFWEMLPIFCCVKKIQENILLKEESKQEELEFEDLKKTLLEYHEIHLILNSILFDAQYEKQDFSLFEGIIINQRKVKRVKLFGKVKRNLYKNNTTDKT